MRGVKICAAFMGIAAGLTGQLAHAQDAREVRVGLTLVPAPLGGLDDNGTRVGSEFAFGVMPTVDVALHPNLFVGVASNVTFHVRARGAADDVAPGRETDLLLRLGAGLAAGERLHFYGYFAPGYGFMSGFPQGDTFGGWVIGLHAGARVDASPRFFLNGEVGYQHGFQRATIDGVEGHFGASWVQVGLGVGVRV